MSLNKTFPSLLLKVVSMSSCCKEARCSFVVKAFTHGVMGRRIDGMDPMSYFPVNNNNSSSSDSSNKYFSF